MPTTNELKTEVDELRAEIADLKDRLARFEISAPPELRSLAIETIAEAIAADPAARFEVLADWRHPGGLTNYRQGAVIRADHNRWLVDHARSGLLLGVPQDQHAIIQRYRAEYEEGRRKAQQDASAARAAQARAEAEAAEQAADAAAARAAASRAELAALEGATP